MSEHECGTRREVSLVKAWERTVKEASSLTMVLMSMDLMRHGDVATWGAPGGVSDGEHAHSRELQLALDAFDERSSQIYPYCSALDIMKQSSPVKVTSSS